ncbi:hypothetical protein, partial [Rhodococcus marinonascens]|uniref:hypothetical protein n=1 Tax=Rhodococcus marinonascens TaxID=38311 RepID=UPI000934D729
MSVEVPGQGKAAALQLREMETLRTPWYWRRVRQEARNRWLTQGSRGLRGMTLTPPPITDEECATLIASLVETTGGRWPDSPARIARILTRLDIDGSAEQMAGTIQSLTGTRDWHTRALEVEASAAEWWRQA